MAEKKVVGLNNLKVFYTQLKEKFALKEDDGKKVLYTDNTSADALSYTKSEIDAKLSSTHTDGNSVLFIYPSNNTVDTFTKIQNNINNKIIKKNNGTDTALELLDTIFASSDQVIFSRFYPTLNYQSESDTEITTWNPNTYNLGNIQILNKNNGSPTWTYDGMNVVNAEDTIAEITILEKKIAALEKENTTLKSEITTLKRKPHYSKSEIETIVKNYIANNS